MRVDLDEISLLVSSVIIGGNLNVPNASWLDFSNRDTPRGRRLKDVCDSHGLHEKVGQLTRGDFLLYLVLCSHPDVNVQVALKIADHSAVLIEVLDVIESRSLEPRTDLEFDDAVLHAVEQDIVDFD